MSLTPEKIFITEQNDALDHSMVFVWVDAKILTPVASSLSGIEEDTGDIFRSGQIHCPSEYTMKLLYTLQHIAYKTAYGKSIDLDSATTDLAAIFENSHCYHNEVTQEYPNSIDEYVEFVRSTDGQLLGWSIAYHIRDPDFSFDRGLENYWKAVSEETERQKKKKKKMGDVVLDSSISDMMNKVHVPTGSRFDIKSRDKLPDVFEPCTDKKTWFNRALSPYMCEEFSSESVSNEILFLDITRRENRANTITALTFEHSRSVIERCHPNVDPVFLDKSNYFQTVQPAPTADDLFEEEAEEASAEEESSVEDNFEPLNHPGANEDEGSVQPEFDNGGGNRLCFPQGAYYVEHESRQPERFFIMDIRQEPRMEENLDETVRRSLHREKIFNASKEIKPGQHMLDAKEKVRLDIQGMTNEELDQYRNSNEFIDLYSSVCHHDDLNAGGEYLMNWYIQNTKANPQWSAVSVENIMYDKTLSQFGNFIVREMYSLEAAHVSTLHTEILMVNIVTMCAGDIEHKKLRIHILFYGPPASGKSFILELHSKLFPEGFCNWVAYQTAKANTTSKVFNGRQNLVDELGEHFTDKGDGTGNAMMKIILSSGELPVQQPNVKDGMRNMDEFIAMLKVQYLGCTNLNLSRLMGPMKDRFATIYVPHNTRSNKSPVEMKAGFEEYIEHGKLDRYAEQWTRRAFIADCYWRMHRLNKRIMPKVNRTFSVILFERIFDELKKTYGITVDKRDQDRLSDIAVAVCIFDAINQVFFTDKYIPEGTPYNHRQLFHLIPLLTIKREHVYFTITMMQNTIIDPSLPFVAKAMLAMIKEQSEEQRYAQGESSDTLDFNYYFLSCGTFNIIGTNVWMAVAEKIKTRVKRLFDQGLSTESLKDLLDWMKDQTLCTQYRVYDPNTKTSKKTNNHVTMKVADESKNSANKFGISVLVDFIENISTLDASTLAHRVISETMDKYCAQERFVTGLSYRYGYKDVPDEYIFPWLLNVIDAPKNNTRVFKVKNTSCQAFGVDYLDSGVDPSADTHARYYDYANYDLDEYYSRRWQESTIQERPRDDWVDRRRYNNLSYPKSYVEGELRRFGIDMDLVTDTVPSSVGNSRQVRDPEEITKSRKKAKVVSYEEEEEDVE